MINLKTYQKCKDNAHNICSGLQVNILAHLNKGKTFPDNFINDYVEYLCQSGGLFDIKNTCIFNYHTYTQSMIALMSYNCPSLNSLYHIINSDNELAINALINYQYKLDPLLLSYSLNSFKYNMSVLLSRYDKLICNNDHLDLAIIRTYDNVIENILNKQIIINKTNMYNAIKYGNIEMVRTLINNKQIYKNIVNYHEIALSDNSSILYTNYRYSNMMADEDLINIDNTYILKNINQIWDENCLVYACELKSLDIIVLLLDYKIKPTKKCFTALINSFPRSNCRDYIVSQLVDLLVKYGYEVDYSDVLYSTKKRIALNNDILIKFNIILDDKYIKLCIDTDFFPYISYTEHSNLYLEMATTRTCYHMVHRLMKYNIKPNIKCLQNACSISNNTRIVKLLLSCGLVPDIICLEHAVNSLYLRSTQDELVELSILITHIKKTSDPYSNMMELERLIDLFRHNMVLSIIYEEYKKNIIENNPSNGIDSVNNKDNIDNIDNKDIIDNKANKDKANIEGANKENNIIDLSNIIYNKNYIKSSSKTLTLFNIKKNKNIADFKYGILLYINKNNLYHSNIKNLIKINSDLCEISGFDIGKYFHFNDIDMFVSHCFNLL